MIPAAADRPIVILGAGAVGREVLGNLRAADPDCPIAGFLDDDPAAWGTLVDGFPVLGGLDCLANQGAAWRAIGAAGSPQSRRHLVGRAAAAGLDFANAIHPTVIISAPGAPTLGHGITMSAGCVIAPSARIGDHVFISQACVVNHDTTIEAGASLFPGAVIAGNVTIGPNALIGARATILQGLAIGAGAIVGAAALVTRDVPPGATVVGVPARTQATRRPRC